MLVTVCLQTILGSTFRKHYATRSDLNNYGLFCCYCFVSCYSAASVCQQHKTLPGTQSDNKLNSSGAQVKCVFAALFLLARRGEVGFFSEFSPKQVWVIFCAASSCERGDFRCREARNLEHLCNCSRMSPDQEVIFARSIGCQVYKVHWGS